MSDWSLYELEDISWDVFGDSCNHLVPTTLEQINETGSQLDSQKKARHDVCDETESHAEKTEENGKNIAEINELTFTDGNPNVSEQCPHASEDVSSMEECLDGAVAMASADVKRANIEFPKNEQNGRSSCDLLDYEWPDFENFDVDNLFRNNYSTFGEGSSATTNEVSWFPSCYDKTEASQDSSQLNFKSSCSEINAFRDAPDHHGSSNMDWSEYGKVVSGSYESSNFGYESYDHWLYPDTHNKEDFYSKETIRGSNDIEKAVLSKKMETSINSYEESSMVARNISVSSQDTEKLGQNLDFAGSHGGLDQMTHYDDKRRDFTEASTQGAYICQIHGDPKHFLVPRPLNFQPPDLPLVEINSNNASKQIPSCSSPVVNSRKERKNVHLNKDRVQTPSNFPQSVQNTPSPSASSQMTSGRKTEESHLGSHLPSKLSIGSKGKKNSSQNASSNQNSTKRIAHKLEKETGGCSELEKASIASFRQLQDAMNQLDIRTKLCIRDGLYRLARNAELRHVADGIRQDDKVSRAMPKSTGINELQSTPGFMDMETGTNPIDRSIAHLLFSRPSEPPFSPADDTISLESRIVNMKNTGNAAKSEIDGSRANS